MKKSTIEKYRKENRFKLEPAQIAILNQIYLN